MSLTDPYIVVYLYGVGAGFIAGLAAKTVFRFIMKYM